MDYIRRLPDIIFNGGVMRIIEANVNDCEDYTKIYMEYCQTQLSYMKNGCDPKEVFKGFDFMKRNRIYITSEQTLVLLVKEDDKIMGFLECQITPKNFFFEEDHIYVSNLYFKEEIRGFENSFKLAKELIQIIEKWAKKNAINYLCSDVLDGNDISFNLNKLFGFKPYKVRCVKKI